MSAKQLCLVDHGHQSRFCRVSELKTSIASRATWPLLWADWSCQRVKLVGERHAIAACHQELAFADHVHQFDAGQNSVRRATGFDAERFFDKAM